MVHTRKRRNHSWIILLFFSTAVFLVSAAVLISGYSADISEESEFGSLVARMESAQWSVPPVSDHIQAPTADPASDEPAGETAFAGETAQSQETALPVYTPVPSAGMAGDAILAEFAGLHRENPDMGGWIRIDGTKINYPVMFTPEEPEKYLHLSFTGKYSFRGVPFIGEGCSIAPRSRNIVVYGHHMKNGSMFAAIVNYKDAGFWRKHPAIDFATLYSHDVYEIVAALETDTQAAKDLRCYSFTSPENEEDFKKYLEGIRNAALYETGVDPVYGDDLLTLSTCSYHTGDGRFIVIARKKASR